MALSPPDVDALLFDLGGVVIDVDFSRVIAVWALRSGVGDAELGARFRMDRAYRDHEVGRIDAAAYFDSLRRSLRIDLSDEEFTAGWLAVQVGLSDGILSVLDSAARRWPLYALTNTNPTHHAAAAVRFEDALDRFEEVYASCSLGVRKPDPEAFEYATSRIGVPADKVFFFDDSPQNVEGACACGLRTVLVTSADDIRAALQLD